MRPRWTRETGQSGRTPFFRNLKDSEFPHDGQAKTCFIDVGSSGIGSIRVMAMLPLQLAQAVLASVFNGATTTFLLEARQDNPSPQIQFLEEVVALVVDDDEGGTILHLDAYASVQSGTTLNRGNNVYPLK